MASTSTPRLIVPIVAFSALFASAHLVWQLTHGGVVSHHLLDQPNLPAFSNWWGLAILPLIGALTAWSIQNSNPKSVIVATVSALFVGAAMSIAFTLDNSGNSPAIIMVAALAAGLVFPIYRAEYVFGFAIGMSFAFGLVLPAIVSLVPVAISATFHFLIRPAVVQVLRMTGVIGNAPEISHEN